MQKLKSTSPTNPSASMASPGPSGGLPGVATKAQCAAGAAVQHFFVVDDGRGLRGFGAATIVAPAPGLLGELAHRPGALTAPRGWGGHCPGGGGQPLAAQTSPLGNGEALSTWLDMFSPCFPIFFGRIILVQENW